MAAILIKEQNMAYFGDGQEVLRILDELKMSQPFLAGLLDNKPSNSTLSAWLKGQLFLPGDRVQRIVDMARRLKKISDGVAPLPLMFKDVNLWKLLFEQSDQRNIRQKLQGVGVSNEFLNEVSQ
jgi:hypothetical protein